MKYVVVCMLFLASCNMDKWRILHEEPSDIPQFLLDFNNISQTLPPYNPTNNGLDFQNVYQYEVGDCWFMASLSAMALRDHTTLSKQIDILDPNDAIISLYFYKQAEMYSEAIDISDIESNIDGLIKIDYNAGRWGYFFEQGLLNFNNQTHAISPNSGDQGISDNLPSTGFLLFNQPSLTDTTKDNPNTIWAILTGTNTPMVADTVYPKDNYIISLHSYTIVGAGWYKGFKAIMLRNPWGYNPVGGIGDPNLASQGIIVLDYETFVNNFYSLTFVF